LSTLTPDASHRRFFRSALPATRLQTLIPPAAIALAGLLFVALAWPQLERPLTYDEVDFAKAARAVHSGTFLYDRGYIADYPWNPESGERLQYALYHPPLYVLSLAAWQALVGLGEGSLRALGLFGGLLSLVAIAGLAWRLGGPVAAGLAALLWATSAYAIQSSLLLDIDGVLLAPLVALFCWAAVDCLWPEWSREDGGAVRSHVRLASLSLAAVLYCLALWSKLTTPVLVALLLVCWCIASGQYRAGVRLLGVSVTGAVLFLATWWMVAYAAGLPFAQPFRDIWFEFVDTLGLRPEASPVGPAGLTGVPLLAARVLVAGIRSVQWLHPLFVALLVAAPLTLRRREPAAALLFVSAAIMAIYLTKLAAGFPKYHVGVLPLATAVLGVAFARWIAPGALLGALRSWTPRRLEEPNRWIAGLALLTGIAFGIGGSVITGPDALIRHADLRLLALWIGVASLGLPVAFVLGLRLVGSIVLGLLLGANLSLGAYHAAAVWPGFQGATAWSTTYFYGSTGQVEAGNWLRAVAAPGEMIVADRDAAYYAAPLAFVDSERLLAAGGGRDAVREMIDRLPRHAGDTVSFPRWIVSRHTQVADRLPRGAQLAATFGDYRAWQLPGAGDRGP
jgi:hypothetical protein